jgi:hypothetical protein
MNCPLISEINPISGLFTWKATSSNASSNIITVINIDNALAYSNDAEYLGDLSIFGKIVNVGISALSNFYLVNYSNLNLLSNNNSSFSNDIYKKNVQTSNTFSYYSTSNVIFSNLNNLSGSVIFGSHFNNYNSNYFSNYSTSNVIFSNLNNLSGSVIFGSNFNNYNSNYFSNYSTSNIVFQNLNNLSNSTLLANNTGY